MTVKRLDKIPKEILDNIAGWLDPPLLCSLALTCTATRGSATRSLYRSFENPKLVKPWVRFLRSICERPALAVNVRHVEFPVWDKAFRIGFYKPPLYYTTFMLAAANAKLIQSDEISSIRAPHTLIDLDGPQTDNEFVRQLYYNREEAHLVLLLALLPRLTSLKIVTISHPEYEATFFPLLDWAKLFPVPFPALGELTIGGSPVQGLRGGILNLDFLDLFPHLRKLHIIDMRCRQSRSQTKCLPTSELADVSFHSCVVELPALKKILAGQRLTRFSYMMERLYTFPSHEIDSTFADVVRLLKSSTASLTALEVYPNQPMADKDVFKLSNFDHITELKLEDGYDLFPRFENTSDWEVQKKMETILKSLLPRSIRSVSILMDGWKEDFKAWVECMMKLKAERWLSEFEKLSIWFDRLAFVRSRLEHHHSVAIVDWRDICAAAGVELQVDIDRQNGVTLS